MSTHTVSKKSKKPRHPIPASSQPGIDSQGNKHFYMGSIYGPGGYTGGVGVPNSWQTPEIHTLDRYYRPHIYSPIYKIWRKNEYQWGKYYDQYQIAKKGMPFTQEAVDFMEWKSIQPIQNQLQIKAIYNSNYSSKYSKDNRFTSLSPSKQTVSVSPVVTYDQYQEQEKMKEIAISRLRTGIHNAKLLTTAMWLGTMP